MNFFTTLKLIIILVLIIIVGINYLIVTKKESKIYEVVNTYTIKKGTPIFYKDFRHLKISIGNRTTLYKAINFYLTLDGDELETVAETLLDKELTTLDKDVLVLKIENPDDSRKLISYEIARFSDTNQKFLKSLTVGQKLKLKDLMLERDLDILTYSKLLETDY